MTAQRAGPRFISIVIIEQLLVGLVELLLDNLGIFEGRLTSGVEIMLFFHDIPLVFKLIYTVFSRLLFLVIFALWVHLLHFLCISLMFLLLFILLLLMVYLLLLLFGFYAFELRLILGRCGLTLGYSGRFYPYLCSFISQVFQLGDVGLLLLLGY